MAATHVHRMPGLLAPSVRKRIFGGFAVILLLLGALAGVALRGLASVGAGAGRVSQDSAQAAASAEIALLVGEARTLVIQYALTATMDDQQAAQASLGRLDEAIKRNGTDSTAGDLQGLANRYRTAVDATIAAVEARRSAIEQMQAAATDLHTIVSATTQLLDRETDLVLLTAVARLAEGFGAADGASARFVASRTPAQANAAETESQALHGAIEALAGAAPENRRIQRFVKGMADPFDRFSKALQRVVAADENLRATTVAREAAAAAVLDAAATQRAHAADSQRTAITAMLDTTGSARKLSLLTSATAITIGLLLAAIIGRGIARPVARLTKVMHALANGVLDVEIPNAEGRDELGEMARAVSVFKQNAKAMQQLRIEQEAARESAEAEKRAALATMADAVERDMKTALEQVGRTTGTMAATADAMAASATRTGAAAQDAATAANHALANAQSVASSAEELAASIRAIGSQVRQSSEVVGRAVTAGTEARATIEALNSEVEHIGSVADMIAEIAARTNLLALNATIEAARAGDAGKGFAVVASEVKQLASQTARCTEQISRHIGQVRSATGASVGAVARIEETITEINAIAGAIAASVEEQGIATAEIARNMSHTATAAGEMNARNQTVSVEADDTGRHAAELRDNTVMVNTTVGNLGQSVIRSVRDSTTGADRRVNIRYDVDVPCRITLPGQGTQAGRLIDVSESGASVVPTHRLSVGDHGALDLDSFGQSISFVVLDAQDGVLRVAFELDAAAAQQFRPIPARLAGRRAA